MAKVAVCLSGQTRCVEKCLSSLLKYVIEPLNADVFFHFWQTSQVTYPQLIKDWYDSEEPLKWKNIDDELRENLVLNLKPEIFMIEPQLIFDEGIYRYIAINEPHRIQCKAVQHVLSMYYSIWQADWMRRMYEKIAEFQYDWVIRCRPDLKFSASIEPYLKQADPTQVHVPSFEHYGGFNDQFAFSSSEIMTEYGSCYHYLPEHIALGQNLHPETVLKHCMTKKYCRKYQEHAFPFTLER